MPAVTETVPGFTGALPATVAVTVQDPPPRSEGAVNVTAGPVVRESAPQEALHRTSALGTGLP